MTADEFWYGEPCLAEAYREAQKLRDERRNQELWLQGLYVYDAFSVVVSNAFGGKSHSKQKYLEQPIELHPKKQTPEEARQIIVDQLNAWKEAWDNRSKE